MLDRISDLVGRDGEVELLDRRIEFLRVEEEET
jgi:hypothetical protein